MAGHDVVISAYNPGWNEAAIHDLSIASNKSIIAGVKQAGVKRFLSIGGAGSLYVAPGVQLVDTPNFSAEYKPVALVDELETPHHPQQRFTVAN